MDGINAIDGISGGYGGVGGVVAVKATLNPGPERPGDLAPTAREDERQDCGHDCVALGYIDDPDNELVGGGE